MIHQEQKNQDTIHRFELKANSYQKAYETTFSLYGILVVPALVGGILMYNVLELRDEYFVITITLLVAFLFNIYVFYQKMIYTKHSLKLIIMGENMQLMDNKHIYFYENMHQTNIEIIQCGKLLIPAIKISSEGFRGIVIGLKNIEINQRIETESKLQQPDYWLTKQHRETQLMDLIQAKEIYQNTHINSSSNTSRSVI